VWGRVERRLARVLGMDLALTRELVAAARRGHDAGLLLRCAAFIAATTRVSPRLVPRALRERAVGSVVRRLFETQVWEPGFPFAYAGRPRRFISP
jgi:hypothetical protein